MTGAVITAALAEVETPLLAVAVADGASLPAALSALDHAAGGALARAYTAGDFRGRRDETTLAYTTAKPGRVLLVGVGKPADVTRSALRRAAAVAAKRARGMGEASFAFAVEAEARGGVPAHDLGQVAVEGAAHGGWAFLELKKPSDDRRTVSVETVTLVVEAAERAAADAGRVVGEAVAAGHRLARYLQVQPGNVCTPSYLAERARELAERHGLKLTVLDRPAMRAQEMGALLAVAQGSVEEPRFIVLEYRGGADAPPVALVGKGVTFDSGGISIKPAASMEEMKYDMSGAAAVLGAFEVLGRLRPAINVVGVVPATENLPSGTALKPGDVVTSQFGKTIEIINTDAEGRLILADALSFVRRFKPAAILDAATLTGAVVVALGHHAIGVMGSDDDLLAEVRAAGERAGERCWPLPLWEEYRELLKSEIADVKNSGGRSAGAIAAGWFLREFVEGAPWAHLDIAGTAYTDVEGPHQAKGPTAIGVRLFAEFLLARAQA